MFWNRGCRRGSGFGGLVLCVLSPSLSAQNASTAPVMTGPLRAAAPHTLGGRRFPDLVANGVVSGAGYWQGNPVQGDRSARADLSNGQIFVQKTSGWWQFYAQAGAYEIPILGVRLMSAATTMADLFGPVPVAYLKIAPNRSTSILVGSLPGLVGAESTFTFQNMNINRGLLWNQENDVNRGIQLNQSVGKFAASVSWNDGYWSNRYSCLSGSLTYTDGPHSLAFSAMGNLSQTAFRSAATPAQNNSSLYAVVYTLSKGQWVFQPYVQYTSVPTNPKAGIAKGASTRGAALLFSRAFPRGFSLAGRGEYIASTGSAAAGSVNLLYGPGSAAWSITLTPTFQTGHFFARGDLSLVGAIGAVPGHAFGPSGTNRYQPRAAVEAGFLF